MEQIQLQQTLENLRNSINILPEDREYHIYRELILAQLTINQIKAPKSIDMMFHENHALASLFLYHYRSRSDMVATANEYAELE